MPVMLSKVLSAGLKGIDAYLIEVEVDIASGLANWNTVGLPESSVKEGRERVIGAIRNSGYDFHRRRITINLAPANLRKDGTALDLPIAVGLLASSGVIPRDSLTKTILLGELSLQGEVKPIAGILSIALLAKKKELNLILPSKNLTGASVVEGLELVPAETLADVVRHLTGEKPIRLVRGVLPAEGTANPVEGGTEKVDFSEVKGQAFSKRAFEIAAAGNHNLLMVGPPGSGKSMLAERLPTILPPLNSDEAIETTRIYGTAGLLNGGGPLIRERPFRSPHHMISDAGLAGDGQAQFPGEMTLAHNGVLFLDEFPEFRRNVLEILRQPIETGRVTLARARRNITYPARFMLVAAMNPCRCGWVGSGLRDCLCTPLQLHHYRTRLSGPLLDRIDIQIEVPALRREELLEEEGGEESSSIRARVLKARAVQAGRYGGLKILTNSQLRGRSIRRFCPLDRLGHSLLDSASEKLGLSARSFDRVLKVARTIADLAGSGTIEAPHLAEAIQYRTLDRNFQ